ncbi:MAG TPA: PIN domain-containing protein [Methylomirabilota bacterium]
MSRIFWDTGLFVHLFSGADARSERVASLRQRMLERQDELCTSALTLAEVLVKPLQRGDEALRERYERALAQAVRVIPFDRDAARLYAEIRQDRSIRAPDAFQLACAGAARVDLFIANDDRLGRCTVPGVQFIASLERAFL